jgi:hypothetical protein
MNYETLTSLLRENRSFTEIAQLLGCCRSTLKRHATQLRLSGFFDPERAPPPAFECSPCEVTFEDEPKRSTSGGVTLMDLRDDQCRFPVAYEDQHYFCGAARRDHRTRYCAKHHSVAWIKLPSRANSTAQKGHSAAKTECPDP